MRFPWWHIRTAECYVAISNDGVEENLMRWKNVHNNISSEDKRQQSCIKHLIFCKKFCVNLYVHDQKYTGLKVLSGQLGFWTVWLLQMIPTLLFCVFLLVLQWGNTVFLTRKNNKCGFFFLEIPVKCLFSSLSSVAFLFLTTLACVLVTVSKWANWNKTQFMWADCGYW